MSNSLTMCFVLQMTGHEVAILRVENLCKQYPPPPRWARPLIKVASSQVVDAVHDVTFDVEAGKVVGLIGPNGAGKSTLIRLIAGLLEPTSGSVSIDPGTVDRTKGRLGLILDGDQGLYPRLTGLQNLEFFGVISGLTREHSKRRSAQLMKTFDLAGRDKLVFGYSSGMRLRLSLARALIADPALVLLDEPTRSLDPIASAETGALLRQLADAGLAVLVANHRLDEVVGLCDQVVAIIGGEIRFDGSPSELGDGSAAQAALLELLSGNR